MNPDLNWHVVFTKPNCEKKVAQILSQRGIETYCPRQPHAHKWQSRETASRKPLFPSWVFVYCDDGQLTTLTKCKGVVNVVYWLGQPAVVPQEQINTIKFVLSRFKQICLLKTDPRGEENTPLQQETALIFPLPSLGYSLVVPEETETIPELLGANGLTVSTPERPYPKSRFSNLLRQLPTLLATRKTAI